MYHIKKDKRSILTARLLSEALLALIEENGGDHLTVTGLTNRAQVGRATFYRNFDSIQDVLKYQIDMKIQELLAFMFEELEKLPYFSQEELYVHFFRFWNKNDALLHALISIDQIAIFKAQFREVYQHNIVFLRDMLQINDTQWSYLTVLLSGILTDGLFEWIRKGKKESPQEISGILKLPFDQFHNLRLSIQHL